MVNIKWRKQDENGKQKEIMMGKGKKNKNKKWKGGEEIIQEKKINKRRKGGEEIIQGKKII